MGPDDFYTIFQLEGRDAAAGYTLRPDQRAQGVPPNWMLYIMVASADASAKRAKELGGTVIVDAFDVFDAGRMAVLQDPTGAFFTVWEPKKSQGIGIGHVDGTLCWADLSTPDPQRAGKFYGDLFGWQMLADDEDPEHDYLHIKNGEHFIGGIPPARDRNPNAPPHWLVYFLTSNCDAAADKAKAVGWASLRAADDHRECWPHGRGGGPAGCGVRALPAHTTRGKIAAIQLAPLDRAGS